MSLLPPPGRRPAPNGLLLLLLVPAVLHCRGSERDTMETARSDTLAFLGPAASWVDARVELLDVQGLHGGRNIRVTGAGAVFVQVVAPGDGGLREKRYARPAPGRPAEAHPEAAELLACVVRNGFASIGTDHRPGVPDEARMRIVITSADGTSREAAFWEGTPCPPTDGQDSPRERFGAVMARLRGFQADLEENTPPVYEGPYQPGAWEAWVGSAAGGAARPSRGGAPAPGEALRGPGRIHFRGGCEVLAEGLLLLEPRGRHVQVTLKNRTPYGFFFSPDGAEIPDFQVRVPRDQAAAFLSRLKSALDCPSPNLHPSTRAARVEIDLPLESGTMHQELDELRGDRDVEPALEAIEALVRQCHAARRQEP